MVLRIDQGVISCFRNLLSFCLIISEKEWLVVNTILCGSNWTIKSWPLTVWFESDFLGIVSSTAQRILLIFRLENTYKHMKRRRHYCVGFKFCAFVRTDIWQFKCLNISISYNSKVQSVFFNLGPKKVASVQSYKSVLERPELCSLKVVHFDCEKNRLYEHSFFPPCLRSNNEGQVGTYLLLAGSL